MDESLQGAIKRFIVLHKIRMKVYQKRRELDREENLVEKVFE